MIRKMVAGSIAIILVLALCAGACAQVAGINILGMRAAQDRPVWYFAVRAMDQNGVASNARANEFRFVAGEEEIELKADPVAGNQIGHIIVVDTSRYYDNSKKEYIKTEHVQTILYDYLSTLPSDERVRFVCASKRPEPQVTEYMTVESARNFVAGIKLDTERSADMNSALSEAFRLAVDYNEYAPVINNVFIVADPDIKNNADSGRSLGVEALRVREQSGQNFDVMVAMPYRQTFMNEIKGERLSAMESGFEAFRSLAQQANGRYVELPQDDKGVDTHGLYTQISAWAGTVHCYEVDFSAVSGHLPKKDGKVHNVPVSVYCHDGNGRAVRSVEIALNTALLPEPELTPTPVPSMDPTPTPAPTPVVSMEQSDAMAMRAISALSSLGYLEQKEYKEFNSLCYNAYVEFCKNNGLDVAIEGIFENAFEVLISADAVPAATPVPEPTAVPEPTVPPQGYRLNDEDPEDGSGFIARMQTILGNLNCYEKDQRSRNGRFDEATLAAVNRYCSTYGWTNDLANGVSKKICEDILTNGPERKPYEEQEPTLQEKLSVFLQQEIRVGSLVLSMWIPVMACVVFVFLILLMIILLQRGKEKPEKPEKAHAAPQQPAPVSVPMDEVETAPQYFTRLLKFTVDYAGHVHTAETELREGKPCTIGRRNDCQLVLDSTDKKASRLHAELHLKNNQVYVRDVSSYQNTMVNGLKAHRGGDGAAPGTPLGNGDVLQIGDHSITVRW